MKTKLTHISQKWHQGKTREATREGVRPNTDKRPFAKTEQQTKAVAQRNGKSNEFELSKPHRDTHTHTLEVDSNHRGKRFARNTNAWK